MKIKENHKKFKILDMKVVSDEVDYIEVNYNKGLCFEDAEIKEEVEKLTDEYIRKLSALVFE